MGKDSNLKLQFDELIKSGERAAASLDGAALEKVTNGLAQWEEALVKTEVDEDFLNYVRKKIVRYREICGFVAETMYNALVYASQGSTDGPTKTGYGKNGHQEPAVAQPVLMKTYG